MIQEEKAKAYDKAIERAKDCYNDGLSLHQPVKNVLEYLFPELTESEEEKIRKAIVNVIENGFTLREDCHYFFDDFTKEQMLAWLEKQGEQKPMPQDYDEAFDEFMSQIPEKDPNGGDTCYDYDDMLSAIQFGIKWQKEQKPEKYTLEQAAEKYTLEQAAEIFLYALSKTPFNNKPITDAQIITKELLLLLRDPKQYHPDAINEQQPAEWSEEDKLSEFEQCLKSTTNVYVEQGRHMEDWDAIEDAKELLEIVNKQIKP